MEAPNVSAADLRPYELMQKVADFFERLEAPYRIVGSMASMAYGEARFTNDIDVLVDLRDDQADAFEREFPAPDYYVSVPAIREAIRARHQFNIVHLPSGLKIDVIQRKDTEFGRLDIQHGQRLKSEGYYDVWFASPENIILMKLRYFFESASEKHLRDVASILLVQDAAIDRAYISEWARKLGVEAEWQMVCDRLKENAG
jgi:hypothetical protein